MPITAFNSFTDGLEPSRRSREHFVTSIDIADDRLWVPYADGVWLQPCHFNVTSGGFSVVLRGLPGAMLGTHYHVGIVRGYTMRGHWRYLEHDWIARAGDYVFEPPGETHTLIVDKDVEEMITFFNISGCMYYVDEQDRNTGFEDVFTKIDMCRKHYIEVGLGADYVNQFVR